jgi:spore germination cell wall hydrolase CwlJ-like protein
LDRNRIATLSFGLIPCPKGLCRWSCSIILKGIGHASPVWPILSRINCANRIESSILSNEQNSIVAYQAAPKRTVPRSTWLLPSLAALCLLPAYQLNWQSGTPSAEDTSPTQKVVDALRLAVVSPAAAAVSAAVQVQETADAANGGNAAQLQFLGSAGDRDRAIDCLAVAAWYEAGTDIDHQRSVMQVVLNRVAHPSFPKSVCGVVFEGSHRTTGCQFTFTCDGSMVRRRPSPAAMARARAVAALALKITIHPDVAQATHYHADYVMPWWASKLVRLGKVGPHIFYRWAGARGALAGRPSSAGEADLAQLSFHAISRDSSIAAPGVLLPPDQTATAMASLPATVPLADMPTSEPAPAIPAPKTDGAIFLAVDKASPSGRWAVSALGKCSGQNGCRVLAYESPEQSARNSTVSARAREKPIFLFVRDATSGIELALWDCEKVERPASSQCLPGADRELGRLLQGRSG